MCGLNPYYYPYYVPWFEDYPAQSELDFGFGNANYFSCPPYWGVSAGDIIDIWAWPSGPVGNIDMNGGYATWEMYNETTGWDTGAFTRYVTTIPPYTGGTAESIIESFPNTGANFPNFGTASMSQTATGTDGQYHNMSTDIYWLDTTPQARNNGDVNGRDQTSWQWLTYSQ
jgi:hypothetical protein